MQGIIYKWTCKKTGKSYVGQTINDVKRKADFLNENRFYTSENSKIDIARREYGLDKGEWERTILKSFECKDGEEKQLIDKLNLWEKYYIEKYDTFNNGYNSTDGGSYSFIISEEAKEKCKVWLGKNRYPETNISIREKQKGRIKSDKEKEKIRKAVLNKSVGKAVLQYDLDGNFIKEYKTLTEAMKGVKGKKSEYISRCAKGLQKTSHGYIWKFKEKENEKIKRGINGFYFHKHLGKYKARIRHKGKEYNLGFFRNEKAASIIYRLALKHKEKDIDKWFKDIEETKQFIIRHYDK